jgi:hypothetical protein
VRLADTNIAVDAANWTVDKLYRMANNVAADANKRTDEMKANSSAISALRARADALTNPDARAAAQVKVGELSRRQAQIVIDWRNFTNGWKDTAAKAGAFLKNVGLNVPSLNLNGIGAVPVIVPIAIAAAVLIAAGYVAVVATSNATVAKAVSAQSRAFADFESGKLTFDQYQQVSANINATTRSAAEAAGAGSIADILKKATPVLLIVGAILLLPRVLDAVKGMRRAAA